MSYRLEAYLASLSALGEEARYPVPRVFYALDDQLALIPLTRDADLGERWPAEASASGTVARVSADYFGGYGGQTATVWRYGEVIADGVEVNEALRHLGVEASGGDEWDTVGLGRYRRTETWAAEGIRQSRNRHGLALDTLVSALRHAAGDRKVQARVRAGAARDLAELGDPTAIPHLARALRGDEHELVLAAADALATFGDAGLTVLADRLREVEREPTLSHRFLRLLRKPKPVDYGPILGALGRAGAAAAPYASDVARLLRHAEDRTRRESARALGQMGSPAAVSVPDLVHALGDDERTVRSAAARALGAMGPLARDAVGKLIDCLDDPEYTVRQSATAALEAIQNTDVDLPGRGSGEE